MKEIGVVTIGKLIEAHYEKDEHKFNAYAEFIAEAYKEKGEKRAERIIRSKIDGSYKNKPVAVTLDNERKEELKDEMKNRISMALKDPILQQGFEVICKENAELKADNDARKFAMDMSEKVEKQLREEIAELEKKNRELEDRLCNVANNLLDSWCRNEEDYCPHLAKLEKENAELKSLKDVATLIRANNDTVVTLMQLNNMLVGKNQQLTTAKEIIKTLADDLSMYSGNYQKELLEAKQFLREVEK